MTTNVPGEAWAPVPGEAASMPGAWAQLRAMMPEGMTLPKATWDTRHRLILWVIWGHAILLPAFGIAKGWSTGMSLAEGAVVAAFGIAATILGFSRRVRACFAALALVCASAILVQFSGGFIEAHFHYFIVVALVGLYQDYAPFLLVIVFVVFEHGLVGALLPIWVYNHPEGIAHPWTWGLVHAVAIMGESVALLMFWTGAEQLRARSDIVLDSAGEAVVGLAPTGDVTFANAAAGTLFGQVPDALAGIHVRRLMQGIPVTLEATGNRVQQGTLVDLGGRAVPVEWSVTPTIRAGVTLGWVLVVRDTSMRRHLETELERRVRQQAVVAALGHEALRGNSLDAYLTRLVDDLTDALGVEFCKVLELTPDGKSLLLRAGKGWSPGLVGSAVVPADLHSQAGFSLSQDGPVVVKDLATERRFQGAALLESHGVVSGMTVPLAGRERPWGVLAVHTSARREFTQDDLNFLQAVANLLAAVIERHMVEQELQDHRTNLEHLVSTRTAELTRANKELEAFSYTVSHDLRSPLRSIDGFSRILLRRHGATLPEESQQMLRMLGEGATRMGDLIESVLSLSRISRTTSDHEPLDLSAMARQVLQRWTAKEPDRKVEWTVEPGLVADGDPGLMALALENLLANAWKFTSQQPDARITFRREPDTDPQVFVVEDNGAGFDMALSSGLFQPFHRLHEPREFQGTGIGLATVSRVIQRHGGRIWAEAKPGKGARFFFTLQPTAPTTAAGTLAAPRPTVTNAGTAAAVPTLRA